MLVHRSNVSLGHLSAHTCYTCRGETPEDEKMDQMTISYRNQACYLSVTEDPHNIEYSGVRAPALQTNSFKNPLNADPEYSGAKDVSLSRTPSILGCKVCFFVFLSVKSMWSVIIRVAFFMPIQVCYSFDCTWIAYHNNIWADVELSFLKDYFGTKNSKWPP